MFLKILHNVIRVLLALVLVMPVLGALGVFPAPTADMYSPAGWAFMSALMASGYIMQLIGITCAVGLVLVVLNRTAIAGLVLLPMTVNVVLFHLVVDGSFFGPAATFAWILVVGNLYFLYDNIEEYKNLW